MPCNDGGGYSMYNSEDRKTRDDLASRLCGLCRRVEEIGRSDLIDADPSLESWWKGHKSEDDARRQREASNKIREDMRNSALSKLTTEEREILGLRK